MAAGPSIIEKFWEELDRVTKEILDQRPRFRNDEMTDDEIEGYCKLLGQAQGLAIAIQIISVPHFPDVMAVSKWSLKRYKMNSGQIDFEDTPGCKGYNPMPAPSREVPKTRAKPSKTGPAANPKTGKFKAMDDETREHLANMVKQGLPDTVIQSILKITEEQFDHEKSKLTQV